MIERTFRYRLYPTRRQADALNEQLGFACDLYNAALEQRKDWWRRGRRCSRYEQQKQLTALRASGEALAGMNCHAQRDPLRRVELAFEGFFRRVQRGEKAGYPRFRSRSRYDSLTWEIGQGAAIADGRLRFQGVGCVKVRWHRAIPEGAVVKRVTVRRTASGKWFASFGLELEQPAALEPTGREVGLDLGISTFAATSDGALIVGPRAFRHAQAGLRRAQRKQSRRERGSHRREKARRDVARHHERVANVRRDFAHKLARRLVDTYDLIAVEDLPVARMGQGILRKDIYDQGWAEFVRVLSGKAEWAGREVVLVDPKNTSQMCSGCGEIVRKTLAERTHSCECGLVLDRDVNAARNVLRLGRSRRALTGKRPSVV